MVRAGYDRSLVGHPRADLHEALARRPRAAAGRARRRPPTGGACTSTTPPGRSCGRPASTSTSAAAPRACAADLAVELLAPHGPCAADLGGDLRVHGAHEVLVPNPLTGMLAEVLELDDDAVATSGIDKRLWWDAAGRPAHHLLDPSTGRPAWTGVLSATAKAPTAALAEALAKAAILAGPSAGRTILRRYGGLLITTTASC